MTVRPPSSPPAAPDHGVPPPRVPAPRPAGTARAARRDWHRPRTSWLAAATALSVCVPPGRADLDGGVHVTAGDVVSAALVFVTALALAARALSPDARVRALPSGVRAMGLPRAGAAVFGPVLVAAGVATVCSQDVAASLPGYVRFVQLFVLVPVAVAACVRERRDAYLVCGAVLAAGLFEGGYGLWQTATRTGASYAGQSVRAVGTFGAVDVMALSTVVGYGAIVAVAFALAAARRRTRVAALAAFAVQAAALTAALSRGSWLAVGAAVLLMLLLYDRLLTVRVAVCAAAAAVVLVGGLGVGSATLAERTRSIAQSADSPDRSVGDRYDLWRTAAAIWTDHPLTGVGVKNFAAFRDARAPLALSSGSETDDRVNGYVRQPLLSPHNQYLLVLSEQGVAGLAAFGAMLAALAAGLWRRRALRDPLWLICAGFLTWLAADFLYADMGGATCVLVAVLLGLALSRAYPDGGGEREAR